MAGWNWWLPSWQPQGGLSIPRSASRNRRKELGGCKLGRKSGAGKMLVGIGSRALAIWLPTSPATSFWLEPKKSKVFGQRERENRYRSSGVWCPAELRAPHDQGFVQEAPLLEVLDQGGDRLIGSTAVA